MRQITVSSWELQFVPEVSLRFPRYRNRHAEHIDPKTRELWGNFPQTYSMVGPLNSATRLSLTWDPAF